MKSLLTILLLILSASAFSQKKHYGSYYTAKKDIGFVSEVFQLHEGGTFENIFFTCTGTSLGKGTYSRTLEDSLVLQFGDCPSCSKKQNVEFVQGTSDSLNIDLTIKDLADSTALPGVHISLLEDGVKTVSDIDGRVLFHAQKAIIARRLRIRLVGYGSVYIEIPENTTQITGTVYLIAGGASVYDSLTVKSFKILKWTASVLKLEKHPNQVVVFKKVSNKKIGKLAEDREVNEIYHKMMEE